MKDDNGNELLEKWLKENDVLDKDNPKIHDDDKPPPYTPFDKLIKKDNKPKYQPRKFLLGDEDVFYDWVNNNDIFDKDERLSEEAYRLKPAKLLNPKNINAKLDLHGFTVEDAIKELQKFIDKSWHNGDKIVLIIHGKGIHSKQGPLIKKAITKWISIGSGRNYIRHFRRAPASLGGTGATVIWLK